MAGVDPDGLAGATAQEVAAMAEAMRRVPPRALWVDEYRDAGQEETWEGLARL